jgi:hypothetical protein
MSPSIEGYRAIRTRRDELRREREIAVTGQPESLPVEWLTPEAAERIHGQSPRTPHAGWHYRYYYHGYWYR